MKNYIFGALAILLTAAILVSVQFYSESQKQKKENTELKIDLKTLSESFQSLSDDFREVSKLKTYSISLAPSIENKINTTFGSSKNVTFQYFFTMDGNSMQLRPDSVYQVNRLE